jgi:lysine-N-methylase
LLPNSPIRPAYAEQFRCIGSACEDTCCGGWSVAVDQPAFEAYQGMAPGPLRTLILASVLQADERPPDAADRKAQPFAIIRMNDSNVCPMLAEDRLCRIQKEHGEDLLSHTCATYPRIRVRSGDVEQTALSFSCPEAARLILTHPDLLNPGLLQRAEPSCGEAQAERQLDGPASPPPPPHFDAIQQSVLGLIQNRNYPLWQRLFLVGVLCRRLDSIANEELNRTVPEFLRDFEATIATGALRPAMEALPVDGDAQLDVVLRLAGLLLHRSNIRPRFVECVQAFTAGIGNGPQATLQSLTANFADAHHRSYEPFLSRHPAMLENYLINTIVRCRFPFGLEGIEAKTPTSMTREFAVLSAQFALINGLLTGVAGFHCEAFSMAHVVHTMQSASKHFEHHPEFLNLAHSLLVESNMDGARGAAILLRNPAPRAASGGPRPASPQKDAQAMPARMSA